MFTPKYFTIKYFTPKYFPPSGVEVIIEPIRIEIPTFATTQDPLGGVFALDINQILNVTDVGRHIQCDIINKGIIVTDVDVGLNVNDTGPSSVVCNTVNTGGVIVNSNPGNRVIEIVD